MIAIFLEKPNENMTLCLSPNSRTPCTAVVRPRRSETFLSPLCPGMMSQCYGNFVVSDIGVTPQAALWRMLLTGDKSRASVATHHRPEDENSREECTRKNDPKCVCVLALQECDMVSVSNHQRDSFQAHHLPGGGAAAGERCKRCSHSYELHSASLVTPFSTHFRFTHKSAAGFGNNARDFGISSLRCQCGTRPLAP